MQRRKRDKKKSRDNAENKAVKHPQQPDSHLPPVKRAKLAINRQNLDADDTSSEDEGRWLGTPTRERKVMNN
jgi:hypothetical protein